MTLDHTSIKCGSCKVPLEGPANPKPQDKFTCPRCKRSDRFDKVMREVSKYVEDQAANHLIGGFEKALRGSKTFQVKKQPRPHRSYRFIVDLNLR